MEKNEHSSILQLQFLNMLNIKTIYSKRQHFWDAERNGEASYYLRKLDIAFEAEANAYSGIFNVRKHIS